MSLLFDSTLSVAAGTIDTGANGIAGTSSALIVVAYLRSNRAATTDGCTLRFNNDATAVYYTQSSEAFGVTANGIETLAASSINLENVPGASSTANVFSPITFMVPAYAQTTGGKAVNGMAGYRTGTGSGNLLAKGLLGFWDSTAAISRLAFIATTGQFIAGSRLTVYGLA